MPTSWSLLLILCFGSCAASSRHRRDETTKLTMKGPCLCTALHGGYVNLTTLGLKNGFPRFPEFSFPNRDSFYYFYNPCYSFSWPPEYISKESYHDYVNALRSLPGEGSFNRLKWFDKWKPGPKNTRSYSKKCEDAAVCRYNQDGEYEVVANQDVSNGMLFCQHNMSINKIQLVYKGPRGSDFDKGGFIVTLFCDPKREIPLLDPIYDEGRKWHWPWYWSEGWKYVNLYHKCCCPGLCGGVKYIPLVNEDIGSPSVSKIVFALAVILVGMVISALMFWFWRHQKLKQEYGRLVWEQRAYGTLTDHVIPYKSIQLKETIGDGSYGVVYRGLWRNTEVAVKRIREGLLDDEMEGFKREATILSNLRHHNIVQFMGVCLMRPNFCIVTEFMEGGSVADIIHVKRKILSWETRHKWALDAAKGMAFLHSGSLPLMHRDLKSDNLLVDENGLVKVADFGTTKIMEKVLNRRLRDSQVLSLRTGTGFTGFHTRLVGTVRWVAPEVIPAVDNDIPVCYSTSADVYSYGMTVWEMITNRRPFCNLQWDHEVMDAVKAGKRPEIPSFCVAEMADFVKACWSHNPKERPTFVNILSQLEEMSTYKPNTSSRLSWPKWSDFEPRRL